MSRHHESPILSKVAAASSGWSHRLDQRWLRRALQALQPQAILRIEGLRADQRLVALTIDDAPSPETAGIQSVLACENKTNPEYGVAARVPADQDTAFVTIPSTRHKAECFKLNQDCRHVVPETFHVRV